MKPNPLLILAAGSLGDALVTLPALQALSSVRPVTVAGTPSFANLGADLIGVGEVIAMEPILQSGDLPPGFTEAGIFFKRDAAETAEKLSKHGRTIRWPHLSFDRYQETPRKAHGYWNEVASRFQPGLVFPDRPTLRLSESFRTGGRDILDSLGLEKPLVLHPGSGSRTKNAPLSFFRQAANRIRNIPVLVVWGEAEENRLGEIRDAFRGMDHVRCLERPLPLRDLAAVLSRSRGYLGCDSGVTHLAAAAGTKAMALFGPSDPRVWAPPGVDVLNAGPGFSVLGEVDFTPALEAWLLSLTSR
jgi:ADP-heptose:LPS heptosyltransferase